MTATTAEPVADAPAAAPATTPADATTETVAATKATPAAEAGATQPHKYDDVHKTVGAKAKGFLNMIHSAGEQIRGNINAALDGAGDAVAGRKVGEVKSKSTNPTSPTTAVSAEVEPQPAAVNPSASAAGAAEAKPAASSQDKKYPIGQFFNNSFKRTCTLVHRIGGGLRSTAGKTAGSVGSTLSQGKQRASKRFSRAPKTSDGNPQSAVPDQASATVPTTTTPAETVVADGANDSVTPAVASI